jgi:hypothetical protein
MPFAGPETALASMIDAQPMVEVLRDKTLRQRARKVPSTTFQSLPPRLNNLGDVVGVKSPFHSLRYALFTLESGFQCASCGEWNVTSVDESAGRRQRYVEDCQVCCEPNVLRVEYDASSQEFVIAAELE